VSQLPDWLDVFSIVGQKTIGGGKHTDPADQFTWFGAVNGRMVTIVSTVKTMNPDVSFTTPSNARLNYQPKYYHAVELRTDSFLTDEDRQMILAMAQAADERPVYWRE
jgi:hypothetical protein